jgi:hypothetical protein
MFQIKCQVKNGFRRVEKGTGYPLVFFLFEFLVPVHLLLEVRPEVTPPASHEAAFAPINPLDFIIIDQGCRLIKPF